MKRLLLVVLTLLLVIAFAQTAICFAQEEAVAPVSSSQANEISAFVQELCTLNAEGTKAERVNYLVDKFRAALGESADVTADASNVKLQNFSTDNTLYCNIVAELNVGATKQIVIGAHYDTVGEGAADNVVGVAALYYTMQALVANANKVPFNVVFVAFDGEENGLLGSNFFVNGYDGVDNDGMSAEEIANTLVMFNIDSIALGEKLYLMCENKRTSLANTILANSNGIVEKPYARGTYGSYLDSFGYGYYEFIQGSDHTPFRLAGIPIAFFFSGKYTNTWSFDAGAINSNNDTLTNLEKYPYVERMQAVSGAIVNTVLDKQFAEVAQNARSQLVNLNVWYNGLWPSVVAFAILVVLAVFTWLYDRKLQKKEILGSAEIKNTKVFDKPDISEIFTFQSDSKSDVDDIFTFKK